MFLSVPLLERLQTIENKIPFDVRVAELIIIKSAICAAMKLLCFYTTVVDNHTLTTLFKSIHPSAYIFLRLAPRQKSQK